MSLPKSYKAYAFTEKSGQLKPVTVDWHDPVDGEIVVKVLACGVCARYGPLFTAARGKALITMLLLGSDDIVKEQFLPTGLPRIPGHEIVGDVVAVPPTEKVWKVGQRVGSGWHGGHCSTCSRCRSGDYVTCEKQQVNGVFTDGGFAEYVTLRTEAVASVPEELDPAEAAPLFCAGVTTFNSLRHMSALPPDVVAVQGIGGLGHLAIQMAHAMGYRVIALSSSDSKRQLALELGAHEYIDGSKVNQTEALLQRGGAKLIICTAPNPSVIESLVPALAVNGELLSLAIVPSANVPLALMVSKRLSIRGWPSGTAKDSQDCLEFAVTNGIKCMVEKFPLDKAQEAYDRRGSARFRAVIVP
ncbi:GroES-like protein [Sparassis latifolia]